MPRPSRWSESSDDGSAAVEFILAGVVLLVPLVYLVVVLGALQEQTLGAEAGARHIARAVATWADDAAASRAAAGVLDAVVEQYGLDAGDVEVRIDCGAASRCPEAGATMRVTVATRVALPLVPRVLGIDRLASIPVEATAVQKVSRFWAGP